MGQIRKPWWLLITVLEGTNMLRSCFLAWFGGFWRNKMWSISKSMTTVPSFPHVHKQIIVTTFQNLKKKIWWQHSWGAKTHSYKLNHLFPIFSETCEIKQSFKIHCTSFSLSLSSSLPPLFLPISSSCLFLPAWQHRVMDEVMSVWTLRLLQRNNDSKLMLIRKKDDANITRARASFPLITILIYHSASV